MVLLRRLLSFFCLAFSQSLFSQLTITGTFADSMHAPIPYAVITLKAATDGNPAATQSDSSGTFSFTHINAGTYSITISHVGFGPCAITFDLRHDTAFAIQLGQSNESLKGVTITGSQALVERSADKVVYNVANSVTAAGSDALQAISQVPGVRVTHEEISVAGKGMVRVLI